MRAVVGLVVAGLLASSPALAEDRGRINANPGFLIGRSGGGRAGRLNIGAAAAHVFTLVSDFALAQSPRLPNVSHPANFVALCLPKDQPDGGAVGQCVTVDGVTQFTGYADGTGTDVVGNFATYGGLGPKAWNDITDAKHPTVTNATIRALQGGDYTICAAGYSTTKQAATEIWYEAYDGTRDTYAEATGGTFACIDAAGGAGPGALTQNAGGMPQNGESVVCCSRTGGVLTAFYNAAANVGTLSVASGGALTSAGFHMGAGFGAGNATRGNIHWFAFWNVGLTPKQMETEITWGWWGASGILTNVGTVGALLGKDNTPDSGFVDLFSLNAVITDPTRGIHTQQAFENYWAADALAAATWVDVGTPVVTSNVSSGPFSRWKNAAEGDLITDSDGTNFAGKRSLAVVNSTDGGFTASGAGWVNASCFLSQGTAGVTTTQARIRINTDGALDAGALICDVTGIGATPTRYPVGIGCPAFVYNSKIVTADVLVGTSGAQTGSITTYQCQVSQTLEMESPMVSNVGIGAGWIELDGGAVANGTNPGKLEAIFTTSYNSTSMGADKTLAKGAGVYIVDAYNLTASHDALMWTSVTGNPSADGGLGLSSFDSLLYGPSATTENQFSNGGSYPPSQPQDFLAGQPYVSSIEWTVETGTLPDGGFGLGCRAKSRLDLCVDPTTCHALTVVNANTGALGTCPLTTDSMVLGTRGAPAGSSVTSVWDRNVRVYH